MENYNIFIYPPLALLLLKILSSGFCSLSQARKARQLGCQPIPEVPIPAWDRFTGVTNLRKNLAQGRARRFVHFLFERTQDMGRLVGRPTLTYHVTTLGRNLLFTADPKNIQAILATQFKDFELGSLRRGSFMPLLGNGIFTADGCYWEHSRALLRPSFARERVSDLELEERHNRNLMRALPTNPASGWTAEVDLQVLFFRLTLDSSTEFLFGESVNSQIYELSRDHPSSSTGDDNDGGEEKMRDGPGAQQEANFAHAFDMAQTNLRRRFRFGRLYFLVTSREFRDACKACHGFIDHYVQRALARDPEKDAAGKAKYIFLDELAQQTRDPVELRSQLLHVLLAGRDTTASLLGWLFFLLARHPAAFAKLRRAVLDNFGPLGTPGAISFAKLKGCHTLQHYLSEALRLYPVVPSNSRSAVADTTLPRGGGPDGNDPVFVAKGTGIAYSVYVTHRQPELWGPDADQFKPERWEGRRPGWEFLPFNGGPRICLGQQFALTSAGYATVKLLQRFDGIENLGGEGEVRHNLTLTARSDNGVWVRLHEAQ